jgi:surface antigen
LHHKIIELVLALAVSGAPASTTSAPRHHPIETGPKTPVVKVIKPLDPIKQTELAPLEEMVPIEPPKPVYTPPATYYPGNLYAPGNCTWYAKSRRADLPNDLGNANTWAYMAASEGFATGYAPRAGAIGVSQLGSLGHVVYVESVNYDGSFNLSEMNYQGLYIISGRQSVSPAGWTFIY